MKKTFKTTIVREGSMCAIRLPFDPVEVFGRARPPVKVTVNGYTFASTVAIMGGAWIPLRKSHREAAGLAGTETLPVTLELDTEKRVIAAPKDLRAALAAAGKDAVAAWGAQSYSHQREHVDAIEGAAKPETRARRIAAAVAMVVAKAKKPVRSPAMAKAKPAAPAKTTAKTKTKAKAPAKAAKAPAKAAKAKAGGGTAASPWQLSTPPGTSAFTAYRDEAADPPALVVQVGGTQLRYHLRALADLHAMLRAHGDWMPLGGTDEQKPAPDGSVEAWGRAAGNPVGGWYGLKKGLRGRFGVYVPPVLEALGLVELTHDAKNNRVRAK